MQAGRQADRRRWRTVSVSEEDAVASPEQLII